MFGTWIFIAVSFIGCKTCGAAGKNFLFNFATHVSHNVVEFPWIHFNVLKYGLSGYIVNLYFLKKVLTE